MRRQIYPTPRCFHNIINNSYVLSKITIVKEKVKHSCPVTRLYYLRGRQSVTLTIALHGCLDLMTMIRTKKSRFKILQLMVIARRFIVYGHIQPIYLLAIPQVVCHQCLWMLTMDYQALSYGLAWVQEMNCVSSVTWIHVQPWILEIWQYINGWWLNTTLSRKIHTIWRFIVIRAFKIALRSG